MPNSVAIKDERLADKLRIRRLNILVTNDDGETEGLRMLLEVAKGFGNVHAIIPEKQRSAVSGALTLHKPIRKRKHRRDVDSINGTPSDCVIFYLHTGEYPKPDLVLSGINWGDNTGVGSILGSGTIGACWQSVLEGVPAIAFSIRKRGHEYHDAEAWGDREAIMARTTEIIRALLPKLNKENFFSVNMPEEPKDAMIVNTNNLQRERYTAMVTKRLDPAGAPYYWISGLEVDVEEGTDTDHVIKRKEITVTEVSLSWFDRE
ncbi:5'/3'-nucleotidase SurE [Candidatus Micrarchaeota archaeon]|nr:5'/3'-nucleotidase SurE [Candidatus Micrarchaeota archaeon]